MAGLIPYEDNLAVISHSTKCSEGVADLVSASLFWFLIRGLVWFLIRRSWCLIRNFKFLIRAVLYLIPVF